ncbi:hypothetical protein HK096_007779, partial [Nowakowskiella sp. JEL0078]
MINYSRTNFRLQNDIAVISFDIVNFTPITVTPSKATVNPCLILALSRKEAYKFWQVDTKSGHHVLIRGPYLVRNVELDFLRNTVHIRGDLEEATTIEVFAPLKHFKITFNGKSCKHTYVTEWGSVAVTVNGPPLFIELPSLKGLKSIPITVPSESSLSFDDSKWIICDKQTSFMQSSKFELPILFCDDYGFHNGHINYRGSFISTGFETGLTIEADGGEHYILGVWLNGIHLGNVHDRSKPITLSFSRPVKGSACVIYILIDHMGRDDDWHADHKDYKNYRGLRSVRLCGEATEIKWKIQGSLGGEELIDPVRGVYNVGGLLGERLGLYLPEAPVSDKVSIEQPGYRWFGMDFVLHVSDEVDAAVSFCVNTPEEEKLWEARKEFRLQFYINGWLLGRYVSNLGPQSKFPIPNGILDTNGVNRIIVVVWNIDSDIDVNHIGDYVKLETSKIVVY